MKVTIFSASIFFLLLTATASAQTVYVTNSSGQIKNTFYTNETVYITSPDAILTNSSEVWVYIVSNSDSWSNGTSLTDVSTGRKLLTTNSTGYLQTLVIWNPPLTVGKYDAVVDIGRDGQYNTNDVLDNATAVGFEVTDVPTPTLAVALGPKSQSGHNFNVSAEVADNIVMQLKLTGGGIGGSTERIKFNSMDLVGSGTGDEKNGISSVRLIVDSNNNGAIDSEDKLIAFNKFISDNGILSLEVSGDREFIMNLTTDHYLLIDYIMSTNNRDGDTFQFQIITMSAVGESTGNAVKITGVPINSTVSTVVGGKTVQTTKTCAEYADQTSCPASCQWCTNDTSCRNLNETCPTIILPSPTQEVSTETTTEIPNYLVWIVAPAAILIISAIVIILWRKRKPKKIILEAEENNAQE